MTTFQTESGFPRQAHSQPGMCIHHGQRVTAIAWPPMGEWPFGRRLLASADAGGLVLVSDVSRGRVHVHLLHPETVSALAWSPDATTLAAACHDGSVQVWHVRDWRRGVTYRKHLFRGVPAPVRGVSYSRDGRYLASCGDDQTVRIWDVYTGETMLRSFRGHSSAITSVAWSPDGQTIASGDDRGGVQVWDAGTGQTRLSYQGHEARVAALAWSTSGYSLVSASWDGTVQVWVAHTGETRLTYRGLPRPASSACRKWLGVAFAPRVARIASAGERQPVQIWEERTGRLIATYGDSSATVRALAWSPDGRFIATSDGEREVRIW